MTNIRASASDRPRDIPKVRAIGRDIKHERDVHGIASICLSAASLLCLIFGFCPCTIGIPFAVGAVLSVPALIVACYSTRLKVPAMALGLSTALLCAGGAAVVTGLCIAGQLHQR